MPNPPEPGARGDLRFPSRPGDGEWLRVTLGSIGDAVITTDLEGCVTFLNPVAEALTGWTLADATGEVLEKVFRIINEDSRHTVENPAVRALREGIVVGLANHTLLIARDGTERPIDDSASPIRSRAGVVAGVVLVFRDVTARRHAEHQLRESEERFRLLIEGVQDYAIFPLDTRGHIVGWNLGAERIKGYSASEIIGKHFSIFYPAEDLAAGKPERELVTAAKVGRFEDEDWRLRKDGSRFWANVIITALRDKDGELRGFSKVTRDLTTRKLAEDRLRSSEQRLRSLIRFSRDGIISADEAGAIVGWNEAATALFGYAEGEILGQPLSRLMPERYLTTYGEGLTRLLQTGRSSIMGRTLDLYGFRKDGTEFPLELSLSMATANGERFFTGIVRDVSQRRQAEEDRLQLERTTAQAVAMSDLNRCKDEFLAMLSHELRNPLAAIVNVVHMLTVSENTDPLHRQARAVIERQVTQLTTIVDELLEVSRITTGKVRLHVEDCDFRTALQRTAHAHRPFTASKQQTLELVIPSDPVWVSADEQRIEQVITNLLSNATKYTKAGGRIDVTLNSVPGHAILSVRDDGVGISPDMLPRVFDLFVQGEQSLDRAEGGLGVGLTVVKRIVELHGGSVEARSPGRGRGSEFVVRLPLIAAPAPAPIQAAAGPPSASGSLRVLVVDDNRDAADSTATLLRMFGHEVQVAYSGASALIEARRSPPDVALIDIAMPGMDGYEVARQFRAALTLSQVRLIALSGFGQEADRQRSQAAGFDVHLVKPVRPDALRTVLLGE